MRRETLDTGTTTIRAVLRSGGFREDCRACTRAVARGWEACTKHYVPVGRRERPTKTTGRIQ